MAGIAIRYFFNKVPDFVKTECKTEALVEESDDSYDGVNESGLILEKRNKSAEIGVNFTGLDPNQSRVDGNRKELPKEEKKQSFISNKSSVNHLSEVGGGVKAITDAYVHPYINKLVS